MAEAFQLDPASPAVEAGLVEASSIVLSDGETLAERTTRSDGLVDGDAPDGRALNLGYHDRVIAGPRPKPPPKPVAPTAPH